MAHPRLVANSIVKFPDYSVRPPRGGWSLPIGGQIVTKYSEGDILAELISWQRNNGTFTTRADAEAKLWSYYCSREPSRCGGKGEPLVTEAFVSPKERTPSVQGPPIWTFLNTLAAAWTPDLHDYFLQTCNAVLSILECPNCRIEWQAMLAKHPPASLMSRLDACKWVNMIHNEVNRRADKPTYHYSRMVAEYGAPNE